MSYNYVVTAQPPTTVTHSLVASFTSADAVNLIVGRSTRFEVYALEESGLVLLHDVPLYGRIATLELWRPTGSPTDRLFISTERYQFCVLAYDAERREIVTEAKGDVSDRIGRPTDAGQIALIEPRCRLIGLHLYDGLLKVLPCSAAGALLSDAFNLRLEELQVLDMAFLREAPSARPTLALLYQDAKDARHLKTYEVLVKERDFGDGPWGSVAVEAGAAFLIAVDTGGVLIVGEQSIT
jgi:DNA damage-binding protein 1